MDPEVFTVAGKIYEGAGRGGVIFPSDENGLGGERWVVKDVLEKLRSVSGMD
jgi:hypothetical protein